MYIYKFIPNLIKSYIDIYLAEVELCRHCIRRVGIFMISSNQVFHEKLHCMQCVCTRIFVLPYFYFILNVKIIYSDFFSHINLTPFAIMFVVIS